MQNAPVITVVASNYCVSTKIDGVKRISAILNKTKIVTCMYQHVADSLCIFIVERESYIH